MSCGTAFDLSTLYYAEKALQFLLLGIPEDDSRLDLLEYFSELDGLCRIDPTADYAILNKVFARINESRRRSFFPQSFFVQAPAPAHELIQILFGLTCLIQVVDALCLSDNVFYMNGTGVAGLSMHRVAPLLRYYDFQARKCHAWRELRPTEDRVLKYRRWLSTGPWLDDSAAQYLQAASAICLTTPFLDLAGKLYDTSSGLATPMALDSRTPSDLMSHSLQDIERREYLDKHAPRFPINDYQGGAYARMKGYLHNAVFYQFIAQQWSVLYQPNMVRVPFLCSLFAEDFQKKRFDENRCRRVVSELVGLARTSSLTSVGTRTDTNVQQYDTQYWTLGVVVNEAQSLYDLIPAAYRVRRKLAPLRKHFKRHPINRKHLERLLRDYECYEHPAGVQPRLSKGVLSVQLPAAGKFAKWLFRPLYCGRMRHLNSAFVTVHMLRGVYSLADRLQWLLKQDAKPERLCEILRVIEGDAYGDGVK